MNKSSRLTTRQYYLTNENDVIKRVTPRVGLKKNIVPRTATNDSGDSFHIAQCVSFLQFFNLERAPTHVCTRKCSIRVNTIDFSEQNTSFLTTSGSWCRKLKNEKNLILKEKFFVQIETQFLWLVSWWKICWQTRKNVLRYIARDQTNSIRPDNRST